MQKRISLLIYLKGLAIIAAITSKLQLLKCVYHEWVYCNEKFLRYSTKYFGIEHNEE